MEADVQELDADLQAQTASLKLAHTRLERRSGRAGVDLCRDQVCGSVAAWSRRSRRSSGLQTFICSLFLLQVTSGLIHEVGQLETSMVVLEQKLSEAK